jgi:plasmid stabilization system protein ParE
MRIRLTKAANRDLREIRAFIAVDNPKAAGMIVRRLGQAVEFIAERPSIGRPMFNGELREWSVPGLPYVIPYRVLTDAIEIIRFWHARRDRPKDWQ